MTLGKTNAETTIDPEEVCYYERLAETWWQKEGPFWPLHTLNKVRIEWILQQWHRLNPLTETDQLPLQGQRVLDVGCGGGILSESLARLGADVLGIDVVERNIEVARLHADAEAVPVAYECVEVDTLVKRGEQFDIVFNMEVVEHVANVDIFMAQCNALVRPGGTQFVATINRNWLSFLVAIIGAEYVTGYLPKGTHHYNKLQTPAEIRRYLNLGQLTPVAKQGVAVNPFNRRMKCIRQTWVNYMLMAVKNA